MVKKAKAKSRLDKYYELAKEQGYRSRAAFKLLQLDKKFSFLNSANVLIDLCAAPGGWLQVAANNMPVASMIVGVDLVPIKPIKGVVTFAGDITAPETHSRIRAELKSMKADVVLHDGAPNVGVTWLKDAYDQNELVLTSLKVAIKFLREGGTFVTKIFRSTDYNSLLWLFGKLFEKVSATKPLASRSQSAEIFVVCENYKAPKKIDPKLLDPKYVFIDIDENIDTQQEIRSLKQIVPKPGKMKKGKIDDTKGMTQFRRETLAEFVQCSNPYQFLVDTNQITYGDEGSKEYLEIASAPKAFDSMCEDIKLLGRNELNALLKWRHRVKKTLDKKKKSETQVETQHEETDSDAELEDRIQSLKKKEKNVLKKKREKEKKEAKMRCDVYDPYDGHELYSIAETEHKLNESDFGLEDPVAMLNPDEEEEEEEENDLDLEYQDETARIKFMEENLNYLHDEDKIRKKRRLNDDLDPEEAYKQEEAARWFQREEFNDLENFADKAEKENKKKRRQREKTDRKKKAEETKKKEALFQIVPQEFPDEDDPNAIAETIALGKAMLRKKRKREIIEYTYNKYAFEDTTEVPDWFTEDQTEFYTKPLPLTPTELAEAKNKVEEFRRKPIKKVQEAIGRRKKRLGQRLDKVKEKAENIARESDLSEVVKLKEIQKLYKKALRTKKEEKAYIYSKSNYHSEVGRLRKRSRNIKFVDSRLKKDTRAKLNKMRGRKKRR